MTYLQAAGRLGDLTDGRLSLTGLDAAKRILGIGLGRGERRKPDERATVHFGWGGYPIGDDGYDFLALWPKPWIPDPAAGNWPYVVVLVNRPELAVMTYLEGDVELRVYDDDEAWRVGVRAHRDQYPAP